jgi:hypothetical protein
MSPFKVSLRSAVKKFGRAADSPAADAAPPAAPYPHMSFPVLSSAHMPNARLYSDRMEMLRALRPAPGGIIGEVGVANGIFSAFLIDELIPSEFIAFDLFELHNLPALWGQPTAEIFSSMTHLEYYQRKFADRRTRVVTEVGWSYERLAAYPDYYFDLLYIDAAHTYEYVKPDAEISKFKVKASGLLIFNDYIMFDHVWGSCAYGVVPAVNELIAAGGWEVLGLALHPQLFCDIALRRIAPA